MKILFKGPFSKVQIRGFLLKEIVHLKPLKQTGNGRARSFCVKATCTFSRRANISSDIQLLGNMLIEKTRKHAEKTDTHARQHRWDYFQRCSSSTKRERRRSDQSQSWCFLCAVDSLVGEKVCREGVAHASQTSCVQSILGHERMLVCSLCRKGITNAKKV